MKNVYKKFFYLDIIYKNCKTFLKLFILFSNLIIQKFFN